MKYVRTKDGRIIEIPNKHKEIVYDEGILISIEKIINGVKGQEIVSGIIERKADTIEELCDEFVMVGDSGEKVHKKSLIELELNWKDYILESNESYEIYGAIRTDKGLIYVAKMNDKGELELL